MAKAMASDAAELAGRKALQCHGAIGYTVEADLHLYLKRTWALARSWGDSANHTDRVATAIGAHSVQSCRTVAEIGDSAPSRVRTPPDVSNHQMHGRTRRPERTRPRILPARQRA